MHLVVQQAELKWRWSNWIGQHHICQAHVGLVRIKFLHNGPDLINWTICNVFEFLVNNMVYGIVVKGYINHY